MNHTMLKLRKITKITLCILLITRSQQLIPAMHEEAPEGQPHQVVAHEPVGTPVDVVAQESIAETAAAKSATKKSATETQAKQSSKPQSTPEGFDLTSTHAEPTKAQVENNTGGLDFSNSHAQSAETETNSGSAEHSTAHESSATQTTSSEAELNAKFTSEVQGDFEAAGDDPAKISKAVDKSVDLVATEHPEATPEEISAAKIEAKKINAEAKKTGNWLSDFIKSIDDFFKDWNKSANKRNAKLKRMRQQNPNLTIL